MRREGQEVVVSAVKPPRPPRTTPRRPQPQTRKRDDFMKTPWWFRILMMVGVTTSLVLLGLLVWGVVELVPAFVAWLDRN